MIVTGAANALLRSVAESAVTDIVLLTGTAEGAVKVVVPPLAVCDGEKEPHWRALAHVATHSTPASAVSLLTVAETWTLFPTIKVTGGVWVMATEIMGVCED